MPRAEVEVSLVQDSFSSPTLMAPEAPQPSSGLRHERLGSAAAARPSQHGPRRTPRKSLIVVLPEHHVVSADLVREKLPAHGDEEMDVILACAGQSTSIAALKRQVRDLWVLQAPAGTSTEDLRELAMRQAPGDIVTLLLCGTPGCA